MCYAHVEFAYKVPKLIPSCINIKNALNKVKNQDEYNIYESMLDEENAERLRRYTTRQLASPPTDTDESKPASKKRGRNNYVVQGVVIYVEMASIEANNSDILPPSPP